jgi:hypothetical protein
MRISFCECRQILAFIKEMGLKPLPLGWLCVRVREVTDPPGFKILRNKASRLKILSELRSETGEADGAMESLCLSAREDGKIL